MISIRPARGTPPACPFCRSALQFSESVVRCFSCGTLQHAGCWRENGNRCSVFHCRAARVFPVAEKQRSPHKGASLLIALHTALNVMIHFFINAFSPLVYSLHVQDVLIVGAIESSILISGVVLLLRLRTAGFDFAESPLAVFALIILGCNIAFVCSLAWYWLADGLPALFALIRL